MTISQGKATQGKNILDSVFSYKNHIGPLRINYNQKSLHFALITTVNQVTGTIQ